MSKEETTATWHSWLLDAIHKIRYQKQRPNLERISACIRMHHPQYNNDVVEEHLETCVENKLIQKVVNKGLVSYRDPESGPGRGQKTLHINSYDHDLTKLFVRAVRDLVGSNNEKNPDGISLRAVERQIRNTFAVEVNQVNTNSKARYDV